MIPGPDLIIQCPHCSSIAKVFTLTSGNTFGATIWTDGKMNAPMLPEPPEITKCHTCDSYYWVPDAEQIGKVPSALASSSNMEVDPAWLEAPHVKELEEADYWFALASGVASSRNQERRLRILAWWKTNDPYRHEPQPTDALISEEARLNIQKLVELFDDDEPREMLMKGEALRQLGIFDESITVLKSISDHDLQGARNQISSLSLANSGVLEKLEDPPQPTSLRIRVEGFNRLLRDLYQQERRLSYLLKAHGVSQMQIELFVKDPDQLSSNLEKVVELLASLLTERFPRKDYRVMFMFYGITGNPPLSFGDIANQLGIPASDAEEAHLAFGKFLRSDNGKASFEGMIYEALRVSHF